MDNRAPIRLVEGPLCDICGGGLDVTEIKVSDGGNVHHLHRDGEMFDQDHRPRVTFKVLRP